MIGMNDLIKTFLFVVRTRQSACGFCWRSIRFFARSPAFLRMALLSKMRSRCITAGFSLAEMLVVLLILIEIATFFIPKVLYTTTQARRYALAQETLATLGNITQKYALENRGCFPGNIKCTSTSANASDSYVGFQPQAFDLLVAYVDQNLNYISKVTDAGYPYYQLSNGVTVSPYKVSWWYYAPQNKDTLVFWSIYLDTTPDQALAGAYSAGGIDTKYAEVYASKNGMIAGGNNNYMIRTDTGSYISGWAVSIFDAKDHPNDTCVAVGGSNCGM
jgi:type II secretory pathway pseudopilin PulG